MSGLFPAPLRFEPIFKEKIWGGSALREKLNKAAPAGRPIGESWEISGWGDSQTVVSSGEYMGLTLGELFAISPVDLVGERSAAVKGKGSFPLLFKFIDANEKLSIQVHPNREQARSRGWGHRGKTEAWYVVDAAPDAKIAIGFNRGGVTREEVAEAASAGSLESLLNFVPARPGDAFFIPAGTVHAILDSILIYEVQEESNTTLRLYDWNRKCPAGNLRELHIADAVAIINYNEDRALKPEPVAVYKTETFVYETLCDNNKFLLSRCGFLKSGEAPLRTINGFRVISVTSGLIEVHAGDHKVQMGLGQTVLLPSGLERVRIVGMAGSEALITTR
jgi:mannose-6-phosphate isomerase